MGSITRGRKLVLFKKLYSNKIEEHFYPLLVGKVATAIENIEVATSIQAVVTIDSTSYPIQYRWATEEESYEGIEIPEEDDYTLEEFYNNHIHQKEITSIAVGTDNREAIFLLCSTPEESYISIPLGFDAINEEFSDFVSDILTEEEIEAFEILCNIEYQVENWNYSNKEDIDLQASYLGSVALEVYGDEEEPEQQYLKSDFEKLSTIWQLFNEERIDSLQLLSNIKRIITQ